MTKYEKFKLIILLTFGVIFSAILYNFSENGRYQFAYDHSDYVLDTKRGIFYVVGGEYFHLKK